MSLQPIQLRKATPAECRVYDEQKPVYPLGYVASMYDDAGRRHRVCIEDLRGCWSRPDPVWEIIVPRGYVAEDCHSLLCFDLADVRDRLTIPISTCDCSECREFWKENKS